jgi:aspartate racemase
MKTLGIIGGIAPASTIEYYRLIISLYRERKGDGNYPQIIINSINLKKMLDLIGAGKLAEVTEFMVDEVKKLVLAGADFGFMASNTPHIVFDEIQRQSAIPLISIVEAACAAVKKMGLNTVGLFGTRSTMQGRFYPEIFSKQGITIVVPDPDDLTYIHDKYMSELVNAVFLDETRNRMLAIAGKLKQKSGIQALILGGTELPLILTDSGSTGIPFLDTTRIHVERVVEMMVEHE